MSAALALSSLHRKDIEFMFFYTQYWMRTAFRFPDIYSLLHHRLKMYVYSPLLIYPLQI